MTRRAVLSLVVLGLGAAVMPSVLAHGGHGLKMGEVVSVGAGSFEMKTATETLVVKLGADTRFEKDGKAVARDLLEKGDRVGIATRKATDGSLVATRVVLGMKAPAAKKE